MGRNPANSAKLVVGLVTGNVIAVSCGDVDEGVLKRVTRRPLHHEKEVVIGRNISRKDGLICVDGLGRQTH